MSKIKAKAKPSKPVVKKKAPRENLTDVRTHYVPLPEIWRPMSEHPPDGVVVDIETSGSVEPGTHGEGGWHTQDGKNVGINRWRYR